MIGCKNEIDNKSKLEIKKSNGVENDSISLHYIVNCYIDSLDMFYDLNSKKFEYKAYHESPLDSNWIEAYRFILERSFAPPIIFTIYNNEDKYGLKVKKMIAKDSFSLSEKSITEKQWMLFKAEIDGAYFWSLGPIDGDPWNIGADGSWWSLEGIRSGYYLDKYWNRKHHYVVRHSPPKGSFSNACKKIIEFSK